MQALMSQFLSSLRRGRPPAVLAALAIAALMAGLVHAAAPLAGSTIGNQASATYTDASNTSHTATSNVTQTIVQQVASLTLSADQGKNAAPGGQVVFPHTLTNTGNGADTFTLNVAQLGGDNFDLTGAAVYADANGDGLPDNSTPITSTGQLAVGARFSFVVAGVVPATQTSAQIGKVSVTATSSFTPGVSATNTDTATVSNNAVVQVTQSISASSGASPSGPYTVTLTFTNTGNANASALNLLDVIPAGFTYNGGSARWSVSGTTALTDTAGGDPAGISYDYGVTQAGRMTAVISTLAPGQSGTLTFEVKVPSNTAPGVINNTSTFSYNDGASTVGSFNTNTTAFTVVAKPSVTLTPVPVSSIPQGGTAAFTNVVKNTGLATETFEITLSASDFPAGTTFRLVQPDGATTLLDSNNNGTPDTGPLAAGASYNVILLATLPPDAKGGPFTVKKKATAASDPTVFSEGTDSLGSVGASTVDLTSDAAGTKGVGAGPEGSAVVTLPGNPGSTVRFTLNVKNGTTVADSFNLDAATTAGFSGPLSGGWSVVFYDANGAVITKTSVLKSGDSQVIYADVSIPAGMAPATQDIYFRALSPSTGVKDIVHDAIAVGAQRQLSWGAGNSGQVFPGGTVVYSHTLTNLGTETEGNGATSSVALSLNNNNAGWTSVIYYDANGNGVIDAGEPVVTDLNFSSNGAAGLAPGESVKLLVKVYAPAGVSVGSANTTTISATTTNGSLTSTVPAVATVTDATVVVLSNVTLLKEQALDANGDGIPDTGYSTASITTGAIPGACIRYRVTITNTGSQDANNVMLNDATPTFTTYHALVGAATSAGSVLSAPTDGTAGNLEFSLGTMVPGASVTVTFGVRINQ